MSDKQICLKGNTAGGAGRYTFGVFGIRCKIRVETGKRMCIPESSQDLRL
jgi:hypothetical protein